MEPASFFDKFLNGESNLIVISIGSFSGATDYLIPMFHSEDVFNKKMYEKDGTGVMNPGEAFDRQIDDALQTWDEETRHEKYRQIQHRVMEDAVIIPLYYKRYILGTRANISGPVFHAIPRMTDWTTMSRKEG